MRGPFILTILLTFPYFGWANRPPIAPQENVRQPKLLARYNPSGKEIQQVDFSPDGQTIVFAQIDFWPGAHDAEMEDEYLPIIAKKKLNKIRSQPRFANSEVILASVLSPFSTADLHHVDWGREPKFSSNGKQIVYQYQKRDISGAFLAAHFKGNKIALYDLTTRKSRIIATPNDGYLSFPFFGNEDQSVLFLYNNAVNGDWGGPVGVGEVDLATGKTKALLPPQKEYDLFHLIQDPILCQNQVLILRLIPTSKGTYIAESYKAELLNLNQADRILHTWPNLGLNASFFNGDKQVLCTASNELFVFDKRWFKIDLTTGKEEKRELILPKGQVVYSPDRKIQISFSDQANELTIVSRDFTDSVTTTITIPGFIKEVKWAPDSKTFAVLSTQNILGESESDQETHRRNILSIYTYQ